MASELSRERAARAWCTDKTSNIEMDVDLAEAFADILDEIWSQPWLGNATSRELLGELKARMDVQGQLDYRTCEPLKNEGIPTIRP